MQTTSRLLPRLLRSFASSTTAWPEVLYDAAASPGVALITVNRPKQLNALSSSVARAVVAAARSADADPRIRAVVVTGAGGSLAGADVKELAGYGHDEVRV